MANPPEETQQLAGSEEEELQQELPQWMMLDGDSDTKTPVNTEVSGKIPKWLTGGSLYLNGPGVFCVGEQRLEHLYDGFAVIHRFLFREGGEISYQSRILDSDTWVRSSKAKQLVSSQFGTAAFYPDPCKGLLDRMKSYLLPINPDDMTDNTSMNVVKHAGKLYAVTDNTILNELHPETLMKRSKVDLRQTLPVHLMTALPHFGSDGTMYNLSTSFNPTAAYGIVAIPPEQPAGGTATPSPSPKSEAGAAATSAATSEGDGGNNSSDNSKASVKEDGDNDDDGDVFKRASLLFTVPSRFKMHISYGHSFGMSAEHFVLLEQSIAMNTVKVMTSNWRRDGYASSFAKFPEEKMVFHVIRRADNQRVPVTFEAEPGFCFHFVNCHEVEEHLVVDLCYYDDVNIIDGAYLKSMANPKARAANPVSTFRRYVLPINVTKADADVNLVNVSETKATAHMVTPGVIHCSPDYITDDKIIIDMPRINYAACNGLKYRYAYGVSLQAGEQRLVKVDLEKRKVMYWQETGYSAGEPVFVPRPGAKNEDDGVVLSAVLSELPNTPSFLAVLDAHSFKEVGRAVTPCHVSMPLSFHGTFVPDSSKK